MVNLQSINKPYTNITNFPNQPLTVYLTFKKKLTLIQSYDNWNVKNTFFSFSTKNLKEMVIKSFTEQKFENVFCSSFRIDLIITLMKSEGLQSIIVDRSFVYKTLSVFQFSGFFSVFSRKILHPVGMAVLWCFMYSSSEHLSNYLSFV